MLTKEKEMLHVLSLASIKWDRWRFDQEFEKSNYFIIQYCLGDPRTKV